MNHIYYYYGDETRAHDFLFYILNRFYQTGVNETDLKKSTYGKLYLENSELHFNLSHSKDVVALAVGRSPVGIDVEKIRQKNFSKVANVYFGNTPKDAIEFFSLWTKAESFVKYRAGALATDLKKIKIENDVLFYESEKVNIFVQTFHIGDFILSVSSDEETADVLEIEDFV